MSFTLALAQCSHTKENSREAILEMAEGWFKRAFEQGADLLVFPEGFMGKYSVEEERFFVAPEPIDGFFCTQMSALAKKHAMHCVFTFNESNGEDKPFNTAVLVNSDGEVIGSYRKVHLFDIDFIKESSRVCAGDSLFDPVETVLGKIGLAVCYDIRFPELARYEALHGCQLLIIPAAWFDGDLKLEHWHTLLRARAIENEMFVAGLSRPDEGCVGNSVVFDPDGKVIASGGSTDELICANIDINEIDKVRKKMPVFKHRKPEFYN
jgi:deaminated glutathione amidase